MSETHLLGEEWILDYAAGSLSEGAALFVSSHLSLAPHALANLTLAEAAGGALLDELPPTPTRSTALADIFAKPEGVVPITTATGSPAQPDGLPAPLRLWLGGDLSSIKWRFLAPGLKRALLWENEKHHSLWLLRGKPGTKIPTHSHTAIEMTLVLRGAFADQEEIFHPGDVQEKETGHSHTPQIVGVEECICLFYQQGSYNLKDFLPRQIYAALNLFWRWRH